MSDEMGTTTTVLTESESQLAGTEQGGQIDGNPFVPGARVAIEERYSDNYAEGFVEKVHKNGNFTLRGSAQQWRSWAPGSYETKGRWRAIETGDGYARRRLVIWNAATDAEICEKRAKGLHQQRWLMVREQVSKIHAEEITPETLGRIEAALAEGRTP